MMIEFLVLICVYKMMQVKTKRRIIFYIVTILANLFALYLTGCRTAWVPFVVTIPFMFLMNKRFGYFTATMSAIGTGGIAILLKPEVFQRALSLRIFLSELKFGQQPLKE